LALITGATSGIGRATAIKLAMDEFNLIITGRRLERLEELKKENRGKV
jgi:short-subunit dehydrogenase